MSFETVMMSIFSAAFVATVIRISTPIILPALGGLLSELAGVINIALEGIMLGAAFTGVVVGSYSPEWFPNIPFWIHPWSRYLNGPVLGLDHRFFPPGTGRRYYPGGPGHQYFGSRKHSFYYVCPDR